MGNTRSKTKSCIDINKLKQQKKNTKKNNQTVSNIGTNSELTLLGKSRLNRHLVLVYSIDPKNGKQSWTQGDLILKHKEQELILPATCVDITYGPTSLKVINTMLHKSRLPVAKEIYIFK